MMKWYIFINMNHKLVWKTTEKQKHSKNQYKGVPCL